MKLLPILMIFLICSIVVVGFLLLGINLSEKEFKSKDVDSFLEKHVNFFITLECPSCSSNIFDMQDCVDFLDQNKNNPRVMEVAKAYGLKKVTRIQKKVSTDFKETKVTCYYYK